MKKVMVFGTFDMLHEGHEHFLREAKKHGDSLVVVVARDQNVAKFKGKLPVQKEGDRLRQIKSLSYVDRALLGRKDVKYMKIIMSIMPDVICLGYDQHSFSLEHELNRKRLNIRVVRLGPYKENMFKTSIIRQLLKF